ncbi:MAG: ornithine carbamoyltransferase [Actinomycetota bacterium]|jgi:ornithine carbamoyltransferase|nr:ornithine carbamoyltransferase [Actinomycetota bacterium]
MPRHFLEVDDLTAAELVSVLDLAELLEVPQVLIGQGVALLFEKPSARTRNSSEMAVVQLGGHPVTLRNEEVGIDTRETAEDLVRTLACYHSAVAARVFDHRHLVRMAAVSPVPVINLLSDAAHPCQALADLLTLRQRWGLLAGKRVAWVGDGNNVCRSLAAAGHLAGIEVRVATPKGYEPPADTIERCAVVTHDPAEAVEGADAIVTDVWTSMGQESEVAARVSDFAGFTVDEALMARAASDAVFLHCLPAHRGDEVTAEVIDGPQSLVWLEAANRMHAMRGLLLFLFGEMA